MVRLNETLQQLRLAWRLEDGALYPGLLRDYPNAGFPAISYVEDNSVREWRAADQEATETLVAVVDSWESTNWPALSNPWPRPLHPELRFAPQ